MKEYKCTWIDEDGTILALAYKTTDNPIHFLFDEICKALILLNGILDTDGMPSEIINWIKTGKTAREYYFADINGQVISVMECNYKPTVVEGDEKL